MSQLSTIHSFNGAMTTTVTKDTIAIADFVYIVPIIFCNKFKIFHMFFFCVVVLNRALKQVKKKNVL